MNINCNLIKDILPLYVKGETSPESDDLIRQHLEECDECSELHKMLLADDIPVKKAVKDASFSRSMRRARLKLAVRALLAALLAVLVFVFLFYYLFIGIVPVKSTKVEIVPEVNVTDDGSEVIFHLELVNSGRCLDLRYGAFDKPEPDSPVKKVNVYAQVIMPFDDRGEHPECYDADLVFEELNGDEVMIFHFRDKDVEYNIKDLVTDAGV